MSTGGHASATRVGYASSAWSAAGSTPSRPTGFGPSSTPKNARAAAPASRPAPPTRRALWYSSLARPPGGRRAAAAGDRATSDRPTSPAGEVRVDTRHELRSYEHLSLGVPPYSVSYTHLTLPTIYSV